MKPRVSDFFNVIHYYIKLIYLSVFIALRPTTKKDNKMSDFQLDFDKDMIKIMLLSIERRVNTKVDISDFLTKVNPALDHIGLNSTETFDLFTVAYKNDGLSKSSDVKVNDHVLALCRDLNHELWDLIDISLNKGLFDSIDDCKNRNDLNDVLSNFMLSLKKRVNHFIDECDMNLDDAGIGLGNEKLLTDILQNLTLLCDHAWGGLEESAKHLNVMILESLATFHTYNMFEEKRHIAVRESFNDHLDELFDVFNAIIEYSSSLDSNQYLGAVPKHSSDDRGLTDDEWILIDQVLKNKEKVVSFLSIIDDK